MSESEKKGDRLYCAFRVARHDYLKGLEPELYNELEASGRLDGVLEKGLSKMCTAATICDSKGSQDGGA